MPHPWLIVAGDFSPAGGMDKANYELAWHLAERRGCPVNLVAHRVAEPLASHGRVRIIAVPRPLGRHLLGAPLLARAGRRAARNLIGKCPGARVVVNGGNCLWPGINWVHTVQAAYPPSDAGAPVAFRLKNRLTRALGRHSERLALRRSPLLIANSARTRRDLIGRVGLAPERIGVVYLGTDPLRYGRVGPAERTTARRRFGVGEETVVLFVGALGYDTNKGLDTLLRACRRLPGEGGRLTVLAAGSGALDYWRARVAACGLEGRVRLLGHVPDMPALLAAADLFVSPTRYDAYGLAVHESLCRGVPAIVSRIAGVAERYPPELESLLLDDPEDNAELAGRITAVVADGERLRAALQPFAEELRGHTWEHMAEQMVALVEGRTVNRCEAAIP
jgi:glycosyltransferase involved in cell wall biosynthesis